MNLRNQLVNLMKDYNKEVAASLARDIKKDCFTAAAGGCSGRHSAVPRTHAEAVAIVLRSQGLNVIVDTDYMNGDYLLKITWDY